MSKQTAGIHHITAFAGDPQTNVDFYAGILGLRLVKRTINFDAPDVYHLYFGNEHGSPGTVMTFFPSAGTPRGRIGGGQVGRTTFAVPTGALSYWEERLDKFHIANSKTNRFNEVFLQFTDKDGLQLELVEREQGVDSTWSFSGVPLDKAIKGFGGVILYSVHAQNTIDVLQNVMGLKKIGEQAEFARFQASGDIGNMIDVRLKDMEWGVGGAGTVHHIAWRASDDKEHEEWQQEVKNHDFQPTQIIDRQYFHAIYFREKGGILFEIATDPPGFARDEPPHALGEKVMLPDWFEPNREQIEANLQPIQVREMG